MTINEYKSGVTQNITVKTQRNSINPTIVGNAFTDLANLLIDISVSGGTVALEDYYTIEQSDALFLTGITSSAVTNALGYVPSSGTTAFNGNRAITGNILNLNGTTPGGTDVVAFLNQVFYPALSPTASLSVNNTTRELGQDPSYTLTWSVTKKTNPITFILVDGNNISPTGNNQNGTQSGTFSATTGTFIKNMVVSDGSLSGTSSATVQYLAKVFYGAALTVPLVSDDIRALSSTFTYGSATILNTGSVDTVFIVAVITGHTLTSVIDLDALNLDLTSQYVLRNFNVNNAAGSPLGYNIYVMQQSVPYSTSHRHQFIVN